MEAEIKLLTSLNQQPILHNTENIELLLRYSIYKVK